MPVHPRAGVEFPNFSPRQATAVHQHASRRNGASPERAVPPIAAGEVLSFEDLFRAYHAKLCAFARSYVKCPDVAEELVEEVFLRTWELRGNLPGCVNQKSYLYTAVRNQALKHLAHECVVRESHAVVKQMLRVPGMGQTPAAPDDEFQAKELAAVLQFAIDHLPDRCREAYTLYREHGRSYAEIAELMGISVRTVETQLARANKVLRRHLHGWQ